MWCRDCQQRFGLNVLVVSVLMFVAKRKGFKGVTVLVTMPVPEPIVLVLVCIVDSISVMMMCFFLTLCLRLLHGFLLEDQVDSE